MVPGLTVDLEAQRTCIKIPTNGYNEVRLSLLMPHRVNANVYVFSSIITLPSLPSCLMLANEGFE